MTTIDMLLARYGGPLIDAEAIRDPIFGHYSSDAYRRALDSGEIALPVVRHGSQKSKRLIPLVDLAVYLDAGIDRAREELRRKR